jgi:peroxiredoxin
MRYLLAIWLTMPVLLFGQDPQDFQIKGVVRGLPDNTVVELREQDPQIPTPVATAKSLRGNFLLKGKLPASNLYYITYPGTDQKLFVFIEPSVMTLSAHKDSLAAGLLKGSASHEAFGAFNRIFSPLYGKLGQLSQQLQSGTDADGSLRRQYEATLAEAQAKADEYIGKYASSVVAPFAIMVVSQLSQDPALLERRFQMLSPAAQASLYGKMVAQNVADAKVGSIGSEALDFTQNDPDGKPVKLSSFRGKYVLVDFWASWCGPCRNENPNVVDAFQKYKAKNFTVLGVSLDRARDPWLKAIRDDRLEWTHVSDLKFWNNEVAQAYRISSIPQNLLIDPDGKIIAKNLRGQELHERLGQILK